MKLQTDKKQKRKQKLKQNIKSNCQQGMWNESFCFMKNEKEGKKYEI